MAYRNAEHMAQDNVNTRIPPGLYQDPPSFDIELEDFGTLPLCRLEAFQLLREGLESNESNGRLPQAHKEGDNNSACHRRRARSITFLDRKI